MSLAGSLQDFGVAEIFQLIGQQRKTGVLEVSQEDRVLEVFFHEGSVLRAHPADPKPDAALAAFLLRVGAIAETDLAEARREQEETLDSLAHTLESEGVLRKSELEAVAQLLTQETLFELFFWEEGRFAFRMEAVERSAGDQSLSCENVLLDTLRMRDEWMVLRPKLPDFSCVLAPSTDVTSLGSRRAALSEVSGLEVEALERLFGLVDRRSTVRRIIDLSRLGTFQGARGLAAMLQGGVLQLEKPRLARARPVHRISLGAAVSVLAVAGVGTASLAVHSIVPPSEPASYPIPATALVEAREAAYQERIAVLLEVFRWARGAYPENLDELRIAHWALLASDQLAGYSYRRVGDGYRLERRL
jgi:hypothetical protein